MSPFWLAMWVCTLASCWLLPNHYPPWSSFHLEAWCAAAFLIGSTAVVFRTQPRLSWHPLDVVLFGLIWIPLLQYAFGLVAFFGQVVVVSTYLLGLYLAVMVGRRWEEMYPSQAANGLLLAVFIAGVISVNLQLRTWLGLIENGIFDIFSMGLSGTRPYANIGQPNQLATLLLWSVLATGWAFHARVIGPFVSILLVCFLLPGVALTQSRTAWVGLLFLLIFSWIWRRHWRSRLLPWVVSGLFLYFWACYVCLHFLGVWLGISSEQGHLRSVIGGDLRLPAWRMLASAVMERPWFGYGWAEIGKAQLTVVEAFPALFPVFGYSHNLVLDLVLWLGVPLGGAVALCLALWYCCRIISVSSAREAILVMLLGTVGIHAMLEFPLHYSYFLLPVGLVVGILSRECSGLRKWSTPGWALAVGWTVAALLVAGIVSDYFKAEASYRVVRFEAARIGTLPIGAAPEVLLLTQLRENINFMRYQVREGMASSDIQTLEAVATTYPGPGRSYKVAKALALNHQAIEAAAWLRKICKISSPDECALIRRAWLADAIADTRIAAVPWPSSE